MRAPTRLGVVKWVIESWDSLKEDLIRDSFKTCAVTNALDGSEDDLIGILKKDKICEDKLEQVREYGRRLNQSGGDFSALDLDGGYNDLDVAIPGEELEEGDDFFGDDLIVEDDDDDGDGTDD